jgi:hypothetical protein
MSIIDFRRLAKEAGFKDHNSADMWGVMLAHDIEIERFAKLVAAAEREACAKIADGQLLNTNALLVHPIRSSAAYEIGCAIRARGEK